MELKESAASSHDAQYWNTGYDIEKLIILCEIIMISTKDLNSKSNVLKPDNLRSKSKCSHSSPEIYLESNCLEDTLGKEQRKFLVVSLVKSNLELTVQRHIVNLQLMIGMLRFYLAEERMSGLVRVAEVVDDRQVLILREQFLEAFGGDDPAVPGDAGKELSLGGQVLADVKPADELGVGVDLGVGGPAAVIAQPVSHVLVGEDVVVGEGDAVLLEEGEEGFGEAALGGIGSALDEEDDLRLLQDALDLGVPHCPLLLEPRSELHDLLPQRVIDAPDILRRQSPQHLLVGLREEDGGSVLHFELCEGFRRGLPADEVVLDMLVVSEDGDGGLQVALQLHRPRLRLRVEHEHQQPPEVVEQRPRQELVRVEGLNLSHDIIKQSIHSLRIQTQQDIAATRFVEKVYNSSYQVSKAEKNRMDDSLLSNGQLQSESVRVVRPRPRRSWSPAKCVCDIIILLVILCVGLPVSLVVDIVLDSICFGFTILTFVLASWGPIGLSIYAMIQTNEDGDAIRYLMLLILIVPLCLLIKACCMKSMRLIYAWVIPHYRVGMLRISCSYFMYFTICLFSSEWVGFQIPKKYADYQN